MLEGAIADVIDSWGPHRLDKTTAADIEDQDRATEGLVVRLQEKHKAADKASTGTKDKKCQQED